MDFQWALRIVNGLLVRWRHLAAGARPKAPRQQENALRKQKGRRKAGLS
ncbi:hypothetical protein ACTGJ9_024390 [Bradyrhizobium sp. RDM12]